MQNLHRHTSYSNIMTPDSVASNEDYAKRALELGHKTISSVEHGFQGYYFETYELAKKYELKPIIGAEAYWVKDRFEKERSNHHILLLAKSNYGRESINDILSEANISGYYFKPRVDLSLLLSLPKNDVVVTSACVAFDGYEDVDDIILQLHDHFEDNFYLEMQYHNTEKQKIWNKHLLDLSKEYHIDIIAGLDSHYIYPEESRIREDLLVAKNIRYEEEEGWYMDYPSNEEIAKRFQNQGILTNDEIKRAMDNTDISLEFCDYDNVKIFTKDIKLPTLYSNETKEQKDKRYSRLITKKFKEYMKNVPESEYQKYYDGVKAEVQTYKDTGMADYPLLDYAIVKDAVEHGGLITDSGRGSASGFFTNTLCGFSKVDRFKSAIKLYPERFISTTRILETKSLPDIDLNVGTVSIFEDAQKRVLGEEHVAPMIAFGTLKKKSAFKLYARAKNMDFELANEISQQISKYDEAVKLAEDDEKDEINIYDYVNEEYKEYLEESEKYWGVISDKKKAPSAYLLYQGNIRREIGLIKCKSESTKKEYITCVIDGAIAENYKFLKNDILKVDVVLLIDEVFKRIGIEHFDVNTLINKVTDDKEVWNLYSNGYTVGLNQVERDGSRHKCMRYKPTNISELSAFIAAIRPGFKSMYNKFESRENFSWGIDVLDNLIRTEELPVSFLFFQEQVMSVLNYAGFPMDQCYGIIKAIAKKHPEKVLPLKEQFIVGFKEKIIEDEKIDEQTAQGYTDRVWQIISDNCGYGFNSAHAYCMALDSLYQAWQKAHYPFEFYEVLLQHYTDKGNKDKVVLLENEMKKAFGIRVGTARFGQDNRMFLSDKENYQIIPSLSSIKNIGSSVADNLYNIKDNSYESFIDLLIDIKEKTSITSKQLNILTKLNYFEKYGEINCLLKQIELFGNIYGKKQFKLDKLEELGIPAYIVERNAKKITAKTAKDFDSVELLKDVCNNTKYPKTTIRDIILNEKEYLGYIQTTFDVDRSYYCCTAVAEYNKKLVTLHRLCDGEVIKIKIRAKGMDLIKENDVVKIYEITEEKKWGKDENGEWYRKEETEPILKKYAFCC